MDENGLETELALLSNSTTITKKEVRKALKLIDVPMMKLDTGTELLFKRINRPHPSISFREMLDVLSDLPKNNIELQVAIVDGPIKITLLKI